MAVEAYLPTIGTIVITAAIDSINPCAIGVLILMVSILLGKKKSVSSLLYYGFLYIGSVMLTYFLAGLGLAYFFTKIPLVITEYIAITVGTIIVFAGLLEIKDFYWYGKFFSLEIPYYFSKKIDKYASNVSTAGVIFIGIFVSAVELPCTGAPYLAIITLLSQYFDLTAFLLLILYNFIFISPLIIILLLVASGKRLYDIKKWKYDNRPIMRFSIGLLLIAMGWLLILIANGTINFG